jgi:predicted ATPase/class 3 adenylate cyclase/DNA-binding CsgD family transcriptional regulator
MARKKWHPAELPQGTVTFMLTDLEGSTQRWEADHAAMTKTMSRLNGVIADTIKKYGGARPLEQGEGDSAVGVFARASDAVEAAIGIQLGLRESAPDDAPLRLRIGLHSGEAELRSDGTYAGIAINRCARLRSAAHGGQTVMSGTTYDLVLDHLPKSVTVTDLGAHRLKDLSRPERVYQLGHPELPGEFPPLRSLDSLPNNLPLQMTSFIGREDEIADIKHLLTDSRLITLTGSGGCGKSRLAMQLAGDALEDHPDGTWWVELAAVSDPGLVPNAVADALSIREVHSQELTRTVANQLSDSRALLVLDNCEHLVSASADLVGRLLQACPSLTVLATSREPLGVAAETPWRVRSLSLPGGKEAEEDQSLLDFEAIRLFVDRARQSRPNFELSEANAAAVAEICTRLDGIPLAIELAAARVRVLSPQQIAKGLSDRFRLLTGSARRAVPRQQTLQASVDWSYDLLSEADRTVLNRLSVFAGGFTLEAAEAVASSGDIESYQVLDLVSQLVDRSLVLVDEAAEGARYRLLETIRQYAIARLGQAGEGDETCTRHRDFYLELAEAAEPLLTGAGQEALLIALGIEAENVRSALDWCLEHGDTDELMRLSGALTFYWLFRGFLAEGVSRLSAALAAGSDAPTAVRAKVMWSLAYIAVFTLDVDLISYADETLTIARDQGDRRLEARSLLALGWPALYIGGETDPRELFEQSASLARQIGDSFCLEESLQGIGLSNNTLGNPGLARAALEECLVVARSSGNHWSERQAYAWLGWSALLQGELPEARAILDSAIADARAADDQFVLTMALYLQGYAQTLTGEHEAARAALMEGLERSRASGNIIGVGLCAMQLGALEGALGNRDAAAPLEEEATILVPAMGEMGFEWLNRSYIVLARLASGEIGSARETVDSADELAMPSSTWVRHHFVGAKARLEWHEGAFEDAEKDAHLALTLQQEIPDKVGIADSLEMLAAIACSLESFEEAARLLGAAQSVRDSVGYVRSPLETPRHGALVERMQNNLGKDGFAASLGEGAAMSIDDAIAYASRGRGARKRPRTGWRSLTPAEKQVVELVVEGLTNPEIGERLFVSRQTVKSHLSSIFGKIGLNSRAELAAQASRRDVRL